MTQPDLASLRARVETAARALHVARGRRSGVRAARKDWVLAVARFAAATPGRGT